MEPEDSMDDHKDPTRPHRGPALEDYEALPPIPAPRGMMKPRLKIYHWILIALLLGGFVALMLVGMASD